MQQSGGGGAAGPSSAPAPAPAPAPSAPLSDIRDAVSCVDAFNALFSCGGPAHQFDRYYKDGRLDNCNRQLDELQFCLRLKFAGDEEAKVRGRGGEGMERMGGGTGEEGMERGAGRSCGASGASSAPRLEEGRLRVGGPARALVLVQLFSLAAPPPPPPPSPADTCEAPAGRGALADGRPRVERAVRVGDVRRREGGRDWGRGGRRRRSPAVTGSSDGALVGSSIGYNGPPCPTPPSPPPRSLLHTPGAHAL
jgi:hypothetical protein